MPSSSESDTAPIPRITGWWQRLAPRTPTPNEQWQDLQRILPADTEESLVRELWLRKLPDWLMIALLHSDEPLSDLVARADRAAHARHPGTLTSREARVDEAVDALTEIVGNLSFEVQELKRHLAELHDVAVVPLKPRSRKSSTEVLTVAPQVSPSNPALAKTVPVTKAQAPRSTWCFYHLRHGASARQCRPPCQFDPDSAPSSN